MKLRIRGNSLRLRLGQEDVERLRRTGRVEERIDFGPAPEQRLVYALEVFEAAGEIRAEYGHGRLVVHLPDQVARSWTESDRVGLAAEQPIEGGGALRILVEKDFPCTGRERGPEDADAFSDLGAAEGCP